MKEIAKVIFGLALFGVLIALVIYLIIQIANLGRSNKEIIPKYRVLKKELLSGRIEYRIQKYWNRKWCDRSYYLENAHIYEFTRCYEYIAYNTCEEAKFILEKLIEQELKEYSESNTKKITVVLETKSVVL